jgi:hypothetical protein
MTVGAHCGADVKIHYIEIDALHNQHLSQQEPFRRSRMTSWQPAVSCGMLAADGSTITGTLRSAGSTTTVRGGTPIIQQAECMHGACRVYDSFLA